MLKCFHLNVQLSLPLKLYLKMCRLQLWNRGGWAAIGCARFDHHMGDGSCWPVRGKGTGLSKESGASYLQELLCWLHVALQLNQRGTDQSSPHCLQLPANLLWGEVMNERADGEETSFLSHIRLHTVHNSHSSYHISIDGRGTISLQEYSLKDHAHA